MPPARAEKSADEGPPADASWLGPERVRTLSLATLTAYALVTFAFVSQAKDGVDPNGKALGYDFLAFWAAAKLVLAGHASWAYDAATLFAREKQQVPKLVLGTVWSYPPTFLFVVAPFGLLPYLAGYGVFVTSTLAGYAAVIRRIFGSNASLLPFFAFSGVYMNALQGQNGFLTGMLMGGALLHLRAQPVAAGVTFGLLTIKPHLGVLIPLALLASGAWRAFGAATVTALAFLGASLWAFGPETLTEFFATLPVMAKNAAIDELPLQKIPAIFAFARLAHAPIAVAYALHGAVALGAAWAVGWTWRRDIDHDLQRAVLVTGSLLVSPYLFDYDLAWLALSIAFFVRYALRAGFRRGEREILLALWLLPFSVVLLQNALRVHVAPLVVLSAFVMMVRRARSEPPTLSAA